MVSRIFISLRKYLNDPTVTKPGIPNQKFFVNCVVFFNSLNTPKSLVDNRETGVNRCHLCRFHENTNFKVSKFQI